VTMLRTQLLLRVVGRRGEMGPANADCRRVKWCPCTLDYDDDDDDTSDDSTSKLLVVSDTTSVSRGATSLHRTHVKRLGKPRVCARLR